jgi:uncharacterized Zn-finger protein
MIGHELTGAARLRQPASDMMADSFVPVLSNDVGAQRIRIGVREFTCIGARSPFDHPHVYLDMGDANEIVCPYCSTLYLFDPALAAHESDPPGCILNAPQHA